MLSGALSNSPLCSVNRCRASRHLVCFFSSIRPRRVSDTPRTFNIVKKKENDDLSVVRCNFLRRDTTFRGPPPPPPEFAAKESCVCVNTFLNLDDLASETEEFRHKSMYVCVFDVSTAGRQVKSRCMRTLIEERDLRVHRVRGRGHHLRSASLYFVV